MNVRTVKLSPEQWVALLQKYGVPASSLTGKGAPCPICGGNDRFTYDNNRGRGDWVCRKCNDGDSKAGDGFELICKAGGITFRELMIELEGGSLADARAVPSGPLAASTGPEGRSAMGSKTARFDVGPRHVHRLRRTGVALFARARARAVRCAVAGVADGDAGVSA